MRGTQAVQVLNGHNCVESLAVKTTSGFDSPKTFPTLCGMAGGQYRSVKQCLYKYLYIFSFWSTKHTHSFNYFNVNFGTVEISTN